MNNNLTAQELYNKGRALMKLLRYEEAVKVFDKAIELNPQFAEAWYEKWNALTAIGWRKKAQAAYDEAHKIDPVKFPTIRKLAVRGATSVNSFFFCIMFAAAVLIWGWAMGFSISSSELQRAILYGGIAGIAIGIILTPWSFRKTSVSSVVTHLRNFLQIAIAVGLVVWLVRTLAGC